MIVGITFLTVKDKFVRIEIDERVRGAKLHHLTVNATIGDGRS